MEVGDAEQLFVVCAGAIQPGYAIEDANRADVTEICRHLDGMPLAIELAAARVETLSPGEIARHLGGRFQLLADARAGGPSNRSLRASLDWSRDLLDPDGRRAFNQLGVFDGPFTATAAAAVVEAPSELDAVNILGQARLWGGDESDEVLALLEEGRRKFIAVGDTYGQMHANMFIPNVGDQPVDVQLRYAEESMRLSDTPGADPLIRPSALHNLAFTVGNAGEVERAGGQLRLSARSALETGATVSSGMAFLLGGLMEGLDGDPERAAVLYGAGDAHFVMERAPFYARQLQPGSDAATAALGREDFDRLHALGATMTVEEATEFLLRGT